MKILVTYPLSPQLLQGGLGDLVIYRPKLSSQPESVLRQALKEHLPDAALVNGSCNPWKGRTPGEVHLIHRQDGGSPSDLWADLQALGLAERSIMTSKNRGRLAACGISRRSAQSLAGSTVTLVGAGIVNLMIALHLVEKGAEVEILEASPDPRRRPPWRQLGTTHGGDNARMFCFTEADNYNEKGRLAYAKMQQVLRRKITDDGWLAIAPEDLGPRERDWLDRFHALPRWRAEIFTQDIHGFTIASAPLWNRLRRQHPRLFGNVGYTSDVLRLYDQADRARAAEALHRRLGSLIRSLDADEVGHRYPACREALANGQIAGGLEVRGFTLNIHPFSRNLLEHLENRGVRLHWNRRVTAVERSSDAHVVGLRTQDGVVRSQHCVLSPNVHGGGLLEGTRSAGKIQGIAGLWLSFPNLEPRLDHSVKLQREGHAGEDANIVLAKDEDGQPILILGSGYGYLGSQPLDMDSPEIARLFEALEDTARRYFPRAYAQALHKGTLEDSRKACIRPFTCTGLGIFDVSPTVAGGRLVVASGHNTGGFAQAPATSEAVVATLEGRPHSMQTLYDPERGFDPERL